MAQSRLVATTPTGVTDFATVIRYFAYNIIDFCDWKTRGAVPCVCVAAARATTHSPYHARWLCERLQHERLLHIPATLPASTTYREVFLELWKYRDVLVNANPAKTDLSESEVGPATYGRAAPRREKQEIAVAVRFRPASKTPRDGNSKRTKVVLPLYQRLQLIRAQSGNKKSKRSLAKDLQILKEKGEWFGDRWAEEERSAKLEVERETTNGPAHASPNSGDYLVSPSGGEKKGDSDQGFARVESVDPASGEVVTVAPKIGLRRFNFQAVMPTTAGQSYVYDAAPRQLIGDFLNGFNASIVVYGA